MVYVKYLIKTNGLLSEFVEKILNLINKYYFKTQEANILEKYLGAIIEKWLSEKFAFESFPFKLFDCSNQLQFYMKYFDICVPHLISKDNKQVLEAAKRLLISEKSIVEVSGELTIFQGGIFTYDSLFHRFLFHFEF